MRSIPFQTAITSLLEGVCLRGQSTPHYLECREPGALGARISVYLLLNSARDLFGRCCLCFRRLCARFDLQPARLRFACRRLHSYLKHTIGELRRCRVDFCTCGQWYLTVETAVATLTAIMTLEFFFLLLFSFP